MNYLIFIHTHILFTILILKTCWSWEYCQSDIKNKLCEGKYHFVCNPTNSISEISYSSKEYLAHVPLTRKVKKAFLNWHNYYRNWTAGGRAKNSEKKNFPKAVRMRELIWDTELSFLSHLRTKLVNKGDVTCIGTQRFPYAGQNIVVKVFNEFKPVLKIIYLSLKEMFDGKNKIEKPEAMPNQFTIDHEDGKQFTIMINDRISRLGCAVSLGSDCANEEGGTKYKYCYYTACTYDYGTKGTIYKTGKPAGRCSHWGVGKSRTYVNLCANSGEIFKSDN